MVNQPKEFEMDRDAIDDEFDAEMAEAEEKAQRELTRTPMRGREDDDWTPAEAIVDDPPHESENDGMDDPPDPAITGLPRSSTVPPTP